MRDPYVVLGVPKNAPAGDIKKAFRKLAKKYHPDQSKDPKAKELFAEANQANEILGDDKKRGAFDRGEIDGDGKPRGFDPGPGAGFRRAGPMGAEFEFNAGGGPFRRGQAGAGGFDASDIFADLFKARAAPRGGSAPRGDDVEAIVAVSLSDAAFGGRARVNLPTGRTLEVAIPAGVEEGSQIRLKGQGQPSPFGGAAGDAMVTVTLAAHPVFKLEGRDLRLDLPVTLYEAVLGGAVQAPTLKGLVELTLPPNSQSGRTLRLRGKGMPASGAAPAGDLLVSLRITLPDKPDPALAALMERWRAEQAYDPRRDLKV